jgi:hypothetical protein
MPFWYRMARGFFMNGTVLPLHGDHWNMQQVCCSQLRLASRAIVCLICIQILQRCQLNDLLVSGIIWWSRLFRFPVVKLQSYS